MRLIYARLTTFLTAALLILMTAFLIMPSSALAQVGSTLVLPGDVAIGPRQPIFCGPSTSSARPYLYYIAGSSGQDGKWYCSAVPRSVSKAVTAILDGVATSVLQINIPNGSSSANIHIRVRGSLGAGGSIGAFECAATLEGNIGVVRTASVAAVANAATAAITNNACVAGASTITLTYALGSVVGGTAGVDTVQVNITISRSNTTRGTNHQAIVEASVANNPNSTQFVTIQ